MVDALVLGTSRAICGGSSPLPGTNEKAGVCRLFHLCPGSKVWETLREDLKRLPAILKSRHCFVHKTRSALVVKNRDNLYRSCNDQVL